MTSQPGIAGADVANDADIAACNHAAREEFRSRSPAVYRAASRVCMRKRGF